MAVIFVTHSVEEAVFLADRVLVMTTGPRRVDSDNPIPLPRPRDVSSPAFNDIRRQLAQKLTNHLARRPSPNEPGQGTAPPIA